jgi:hypothetical protein
MVKIEDERNTAFTFPIETYAILEKQLGQEAALNLARTVEQAAIVMQKEANDLAQQKKIELRDEMNKELASKADLALVRQELIGKIDAVEARLERKMTVYLVITILLFFSQTKTHSRFG